MNRQAESTIDAVSAGLKDGGCTFVSNFPGFKSHKLFGKLGGQIISINEKTAFEMCFGASLAGKRSVVTMKGVGLNVALDSYLHAVLNGVNAGLVVILTEDLEGESSPEIQDSRPLIDVYGSLWLEPYSIQSAYDLAFQSFEISEKIDMPVIIRLTNSILRLGGGFRRKTKKKYLKRLDHRRNKYISDWKSRYDRLIAKNRVMLRYVSSLYSPESIITRKHDMGLVLVGYNPQYKADNADMLQLFTYPFPDVLKNFIKDRTKVTVLEQGNPYAYQKVTNLTVDSSRLSAQKYSVPNNIGKWKIWNGQEKLFKALRSIKPSYVVGDEGTFTDESTKTINTCLCMGSSVGITMGLAMNNVRFPFCVTGDTSFMFEGIHTLIEAKQRKLGFGVIVIDNGGAISTGGQKIIGDVYKIDSDIPQIKIDYRKCTISDMRSILAKVRLKNNLSVIYVK